jgi:two-component sensor histidine kinase
MPKASSILRLIDRNRDQWGWDLLTAICLTVPLPIQDTVELLCESGAGDLASETAMPLGLIAKELITDAAKHAGRPTKRHRSRRNEEGSRRLHLHG